MVFFFSKGDHMKKDVKEFKTIEEQINILISRNVLVDNENYAKALLVDVNYYNLMANRNLFEYDNQHNIFPKIIKIEDLANVYFFNFDLRNFLFKCMSYIESSIKTKIAYVHTSKYGPLGYKDVNNFVMSAKDIGDNGLTYHDEIMSSLSKEIDRSQEEYITWHKNQYKDIPFWVAINKLSFGDMSKFYRLMIHSDKKAVAKYFNAGPLQIEKWLWQFSVLRNVCAHQGNLIVWKYQSIPLDSEYDGMYIQNTFFQYIIALFLLINCDHVMCQFIEDLLSLLKKYGTTHLKDLGIPDKYEDDLLNLNLLHTLY